MKRNKLLPLFLAAGVALAGAYDIVWLNTLSGLSIGVNPTETTNISYSSDKTQVVVTDGTEVAGSVETSNLKDVTFGETDGMVTVCFDNNGSRVEYPGYFENQALDVNVDKETGVVTLRSIAAEGADVNVRVTGATSNGQLKIYTDGPCNVVLDNVDITNENGSAINVQTTNKAGVVFTLVGNSYVCDSKEYTSTPADEKEKGAIYSTKAIVFEGEGTLTATGKNKHAICAEKKLTINSGTVKIAKSKSDGIHCGDFVMNGGSFVSDNSKGDGIDADKGTATIKKGSIEITLQEPDTKGITADESIAIEGGTVAINILSDQSKGIRTKGNMAVSKKAQVNVEIAGNAVVVDGDPSYCTGIKVDGDYDMQGGTVVLNATGAGTRGISTSGMTYFNGGETRIAVACNAIEYTDTEGEQDSYSGVCVSSDSTIVVNSGLVVLNIDAEQGKGFKADYNVEINGGEVNATATGNVHVLNGDPSYCAVIKTDKDFNMTDGTLTIVHSGKGGKSISTDGVTNISGGNVSITNTGDGVVYRDAANQNDTATPACITSDEKVIISGGTLTLKNSGSAGKCVKSDKEIVLGDQATGNGPTIYAEVTGMRVSESQAASFAPGGNRPGGWGPGGGGFDQNGDYANPKAFKADGNLYVYGGDITAVGSTNGGEGLESKATLTINGGTIDISTVDDCINAKTNITINGGFIHCSASGNDGIDSNGTITINGGTVITMGAQSPEEGFDCDNNTFKITGGTLIGLGGGTSTPTSSVCTQRVALYNASFTNGTTYTVCDPSGNHVLSFKSPKSISGVMLISSPKITNNGTYTIYTGGTVSGGNTFKELTTDATYTKGTQVKTFSPSSMVTTVR